MKRFDDPMFETFSEAFSNFQPEVPAGAYAGIRNKMKKGGFWSFSFTSLNVYTLSALVLAAAAFAWAGTSQEGSVARGQLIETIDRPDATFHKVQQHLTQDQKAGLGENNESFSFTQMSGETQIVEAVQISTCEGGHLIKASQLILDPMVPIRHEEIKNEDLAKDAYSLAIVFDNEQASELTQSQQDVSSAKELLKAAGEGEKGSRKLTMTSKTTK